MTKGAGETGPLECGGIQEAIRLAAPEVAVEAAQAVALEAAALPPIYIYALVAGLPYIYTYPLRDSCR